VFTSREGLSNDLVLPVFEDHTGAIWLGTTVEESTVLKTKKSLPTTLQTAYPIT
jgi:hypothetical protein